MSKLVLLFAVAFLVIVQGSPVSKPCNGGGGGGGGRGYYPPNYYNPYYPYPPPQLQPTAAPAAGTATAAPAAGTATVAPAGTGPLNDAELAAFSAMYQRYLQFPPANAPRP